MKFYVKIILILFAFSFTGCAPAMYDASFKGKVIDDNSKEPIAGAVALGLWYTWMLTPAGEVGEYYDAFETVTNKEGEFYIPGKGPRVATNLKPLKVIIFKAGYRSSAGTKEYYLRYSWNKNPQDGRLLIPLKKLTLEQRKTMLGPGDPPFEAPYQKVKRYLMELNRERVEKGLPPRTKWHDGTYYGEKQQNS